MLNSCFKKYTYGQEKACFPSETIERALKKLSQAEVPILKETLRIDHLDRIGIPVYMCKVNEEITRDLEVEGSFGKGVTLEQALASSLMELVERFSNFSFLKNKDFLITSYQRLYDKSISIETLLMPLNEVFRETKFIEDLKEVELRWTEVYDLERVQKVLFPLHWFYRIYGTTGWAAGNTLEEAVLQSLCEIIERHCISVIMEEKLTVPSIDVSSINDPLAKELLDKVVRTGIKLFVKDFSLDLGIPTVGVIGYDPFAPVSTLKIYGAAGTHLNPKIALIRALTEFVQHRAQVIYLEKVLKKQAGPTYCFLKFKKLEDLKFLTEGNLISFKDLPYFSHQDFKIEIEYIVKKLSEKGLKVFAVETTNPILNIPSVITVVPGARLNRPSTKLHPYFLISRQFMDIGKYQKALLYIEKAFKEAPSYQKLPQVLSQAAVCAKLAGDYKKALHYYEKLIEIYPYLLHSDRFIRDLEEIEKYVQK